MRYAGYFSHLVTRERSEGTTITTWANSPKCLRDAQDLMVRQGCTYGDAATISIDELTILAWVIPGNGKVIHPQYLIFRDMCLIFKQGPWLRASSQPVIILCLGANAVLTLTPNSGFTTGDQSQVRICGNIQYEIPPDQSAGADGMQGIETTSQSSTAPTTVKVEEPDTVQKSPKDAIVITLVHGDALMVAGDDFAVSLTDIYWRYLY